MTPDLHGDVRRFLKPELHRRLEALGVDLAYGRARGDHLYREENGTEVAVLDLVGGFGATLLGHNHPELVATLEDALERERPFLSQGSVREEAGRLARRLSERVGRSTQRSYVVTLANSGAEAVEAALKHAELERRARIDARVAGLRRTLAELDDRLEAGTAHLPPDFLRSAGRETGQPGFASLDALFVHLRDQLLALQDRPPLALALEGGFHGKTGAAVQLTHNPVFRERWRHLGPRVAFFAPDRPEALHALVDGERIMVRELEIGEDGAVTLTSRPFVNVLACFAEPIQGEGGVHVLSAELLRTLRAAADAGGFPLAFDEIQSGMGRTGNFLASEAVGVRADYYTLAKALGGGLVKISALLVDRERWVEGFDADHTSTYADDHHACAVANAVLDLLERDEGALLARVRETGAYLEERLRDLQKAHPDQLRAVRGRGLMLGVELASQLDSPSPLLRVLAEQDQLGFFICGTLLAEARIRVLPTLSSTNTLRLAPSAFLERAEVDRFCRALEDVLTALRNADAHFLARHLGGDAAAERADGQRRGGRAHVVPRAGAPPEAEGPVPDAQTTHVGFLGHFVEASDLRRWDPSLAPYPDEACARFLLRTRGQMDPFVLDEAVVHSTTGARCRGTMIALPFTGAEAEEALRSGDDGWLQGWIEGAVELAGELGCTVLGFGGYTSIATRSCRSVYAPGLAVTTGNALTAAAALEATFRAADMLDLRGRRLGVVGATGNIGRVLAEVAAPQVDEVLLVARSGAARRLRPLADTLDVPVRLSTEMDDLRTCDLILSATNSARPVILPEHVAPERPVVVSDVAVPGDVDARVRAERPEALVLEGGVIRPPLGQEVDFGGLLSRPAGMYGCLAETFLLGLEGIQESFSRGLLSPEVVERARMLAERHGFSIDEPRMPGVPAVGAAR